MHLRTIGRNPGHAFSGVESQGIDRCMHYVGKMSVHALHGIGQYLDAIGGYVAIAVAEQINASLGAINILK